MLAFKETFLNAVMMNFTQTPGKYLQSNHGAPKVLIHICTHSLTALQSHGLVRLRERKRVSMEHISLVFFIEVSILPPA